MDNIFTGLNLAVISAVVIFSQIVKTSLNIPERVIPLLPLIFGGLAVLLVYDFSTFTWQTFTTTAILYSAAASYFFKLWKTTIGNK